MKEGLEIIFNTQIVLRIKKPRNNAEFYQCRFLKIIVHFIEPSIDVNSHCDGKFTNIIAAGALKTNNGRNISPAVASVDFCCEDALKVNEACLVENTNDESCGSGSMTTHLADKLEQKALFMPFNSAYKNLGLPKRSRRARNWRY